jgi:hypothetical protein
LAATLLPIRKNVALALLSLRMQQPIGVWGGAVVERQRHTLDLRAVDITAPLCGLAAPAPTITRATPAAAPNRVGQLRDTWLGIASAHQAA